MVILRSGGKTWNTTTVLHEKNIENPFRHYNKHHKNAYDDVYAALLSIRKLLLMNLNDLSATLSNVYIQIGGLQPFSLSMREVGGLVYDIEHPDTHDDWGYLRYYPQKGGPSCHILGLLQKKGITVMDATPPPTPLVPDVEGSGPPSPSWWQPSPSMGQDEDIPRYGKRPITMHSNQGDPGEERSSALLAESDDHTVPKRKKQRLE
jgi:hypothetical protein